VRVHCPAAPEVSPASWAVGTSGVLKSRHTLSPGRPEPFLRRILPEASRITRNGSCLQCGSVGTLIPLGNRTYSCGESGRRRVGSRGRQVPAVCKCKYPAANWRLSALCWAPSRLRCRAALQKAYSLKVCQFDGLNLLLCTRSLRSW
jgi:hypothetical protein